MQISIQVLFSTLEKDASMKKLVLAYFRNMGFIKKHEIKMRRFTYKNKIKNEKF
jgi:hypothetical protein